MRDILPGDFYLTQISGKTGRWVTLAQWVIGDTSHYAHAGIYLGNGLVAEAMPGGLQINPITKYEGEEFIYSTLPIPYEVREDIVDMATSMEGIPYSYLGYLYIGLTYFNHCPEWVKRKVSSSEALICSQFVEYVYSKNGVPLFNDGRIYLDVTPGDLARILFANQGNTIEDVGEAA